MTTSRGWREKKVITGVPKKTLEKDFSLHWCIKIGFEKEIFKYNKVDNVWEAP